MEFDRSAYYNGLRLAPFVNMPVYLQKIEAEGMLTTSHSTPIFEGSMLIDRPVTIRFADPAGNAIFARRLFLTLYQPNYSLKEHIVNPADEQRRASMARLQTVLPFSDRPVQAALPVSRSGAQYEIGLRDIAGERYTYFTPNCTGVFISGPFPVEGKPEVIRLDAEITGSVDCYLCMPSTGELLVIQQLLPGAATAGSCAIVGWGVFNRRELARITV